MDSQITCSDTVNDLIKCGLSLVRQSDDHDLPLTFRRKLYCVFEEREATESSNVGQFRRVKLAMLAVGRVLDMWFAQFPDDQTPRVALESAKLFLIGSCSEQDAAHMASRLWNHCDDLAWKHATVQNVVLVGYGSAQTIRGALSSDIFLGSIRNEVISDIDVEPYEHDPSFCAAAAYSLGPTWDAKSNAQKRLEYWAWWLTSAVPTAWKDFQSI